MKSMYSLYSFSYFSCDDPVYIDVMRLFFVPIPASAHNDVDQFVQRHLLLVRRRTHRTPSRTVTNGKNGVTVSIF